MMSAFMSIERPWRAYSGNTTRSRVGMPSLAFRTMLQIFSV